MKHALITGGAGFIGSHLAEALIARDYRVTVLDDESTGNPDNVAAIRDHFNFSYVVGSSANKKLVRQLISDVDEVYHLAAAVGAQVLAAEPIHAIETTIYPVELMLNELHRRAKEGHSVKLFLASSAAVYGKNPKTRYVETDDLLFGETGGIRWSFGMAKALGESLALAYWRQHRLSVVIGRIFNVVGPRQTSLYGDVLPRFVEAAIAGEPVVVFGDGQQVRCFAHVSDVVADILDLMDAPSTVGHVFNLGNDQPVKILDLARRVIEIVRPGLSIELRSFASVFGAELEDAAHRVPDLSKTRGLTRRGSSYSLDAMIREVVAIARARARRTNGGR